MAASAHWFAQAFRSALHHEVNLEADTLKMMLTTSGYAYNLATHRYKSDVTNEISGPGYTPTGLALGSVTTTDSGGVWTIDAANLVWSSATFSADFAVLYDATPSTDATRPLLAVYDFGGTKSVTAGTFTLSVSGLLTVTPN